MDTPDLDKLRIDRTAPLPDAPARRRVLLWLALAAVLLVALLAGWRALAARESVTTAAASFAWPSQHYTLLNATGYVAPQRKAAISSKASGRLEWLGVLEGSRVRKDELIARLENRDVAAALDQARANVEVAHASLGEARAELADARRAERRAADLLKRNFIAHANYDAALARRDKAEAAVAGARAAVTAAEANAAAAAVALDQTLIRAPFDGIILTKSANVGDNITPFSSAADSKGAVVTMADMDTLEVEADVSESNLSSIVVGQPAEISLDALPTLRLLGEVARMVPTVDRSKATLLVKVRFLERDPRVLPDMSARVAFLSRKPAPDERRPLLAVPRAAVAMREGRSVVFVVEGERVRAVAVTIGRRLGELVAITGKLAPGSPAVLRPSPGLADGDAVRVEAP